MWHNWMYCAKVNPNVTIGKVFNL